MHTHLFGNTITIGSGEWVNPTTYHKPNDHKEARDRLAMGNVPNSAILLVPHVKQENSKN